MFAVQLLDALAEAVVLLVFNMAPTCVSSDDDENVSCGSAAIAHANSIYSLDSSSLPNHMIATHSGSNSNNGTWSPLQTPSMGNSSFVQLTTEDLQMMQYDPVGGGQSHGVNERLSSVSSTPSGWTAAGRPLAPSHPSISDDAS